MKRPRALGVALLLALLAVLGAILYWWSAGGWAAPLVQTPPPPPASSQRPAPAGQLLPRTVPTAALAADPAPPAAAAPRLANPRSAAMGFSLTLQPPGGRPPESRAEPSAQELNHTARQDVQTIVVLLDEYSRAAGMMPIGEGNAEITRQFLGDNPQGIAVLPRSHPNINGRGELIDQWGTPYRFHPQSSSLVTVRSAGPDRKMWTSDDVLSDNAPDAASLGVQE